MNKLMLGMLAGFILGIGLVSYVVDDVMLPEYDRYLTKECVSLVNLMNHNHLKSLKIRELP